MVILDFSSSKQIFINSETLEYNENLLQNILKHNEIYVITYPGSYTGIRKSMAITKAIEITNPQIHIFGINLLRDFGSIFSEKIFFKEKHITHCYDKITDKIYLEHNFNPQLSENFTGNIPNKDNKFIDFSLMNISKYIHMINKHSIFQEYYDKFA